MHGACCLPWQGHLIQFKGGIRWTKNVVEEDPAPAPAPVSDGDWFDGDWVRDGAAYAIFARNGECVAPGSKGTTAAPFYPGTYHIDSATQARIRPTVCLSRSRLRRA